MTNKESTNTPSQKTKREHENMALEHESERFAPCAFALEKFLKEYRKTRPLQVWQRNEQKG
ncbi:hypothetical protein [Escherichia coli]|uniref:hypothetical protein n=1 Tax=Escherichia coli TaxID=562 RepID=UPI000DA5E09A|nr:hypothetical protein [Escherichia coli]SQP08764.1 Uncharacterised protein [Escherichia coli]